MQLHFKVIVCAVLITACVPAQPALPSVQSPPSTASIQATAAVSKAGATNAPFAVATQVSSAKPATGCASANFIKVSASLKNSAYPAPSVSASCDGGRVTVTSNGIPNFEFVSVTPSKLQAQNYSWMFPQNPLKAATTTAVPLGGASAVAVNGLPIFGPTEAPNAGYSDPFLDKILDFCNGHVAPRGDYHFHARPDCIGVDINKPGTVIGYAFDGYPILSPVACSDAACVSTRRLTSSWKLTDAGKKNAWQKHSYVAGAGDLDQCNGRTQADGSYAYHATDTFPYFIGCYAGTVNLQGPPR